MPAYLATSCLQGRPLKQACVELLELEPDGLQLTAGHAPTLNFEAWLGGLSLPVLRHHGYTAKAYAAPVWGVKGELLGSWDSVHPPRQDQPWQCAAAESYEVMYPGHHLGTGAQVEAAMEAGLSLAVDVSHVYIQRMRGVMSEATWARLQDYGSIAELHVSANDGRRDRHDPIASDCFGLAWALARGTAGTPVILESYMHRLDLDARRRQFDLVRH